MHSLLLVIFFASVVLILHTYLFYPLTMILFFPKPGRQPLEFSAPDELPGVAVLIAAYNEEKVIEEKIRSVFDTGYPLHKISVLVGSDASADRTDAIVEKLSLTLPGITLVKFSERVGKIGIINHLQAVAQKELLILTDANVMFTRTTIFELVKKFKDSGVGIVAANIIKESLNNEGIALQEKKYMSLENKIKAGESNAFQLIMGAE